MAWLECIYVYYWPEYLIDFTFLEIRNKKVEIIIVYPVHLSEGVCHYYRVCLYNYRLYDNVDNENDVDDTI